MSCRRRELTPLAGLVVPLAVIDAGRLLLIRRSDVAAWALPGGLVQPHESVTDAAVRETAEETGLAIGLTRLIGVYSQPHWCLDGVHVLAGRELAAADAPAGSPSGSH